MSPVRGRWFPAAVVLPGESRPWHRCHVIAADDGVHVFQAPSEAADWHRGVDWSRTVLPATARSAKRGFDVWTDAGLVVVTLGSGCRCGVLGKWAGPSWARAERASA